MQDFSITAVMEAGRLTEADDFLPMIQGLRVDHARQVAQWLSLATGGNVYLRHISLMGGVDVKVAHADELDDLERARSRLKESTPT